MESPYQAPPDCTSVVDLAAHSLWFSRHERALLFAEAGGFPPYLKDLARAALEAEAAWRAQLAEEAPERLRYLLDLKAWFARPDKTAGNFPGWEAGGLPDRSGRTATSQLAPMGVSEGADDAAQEKSEVIPQEDERSAEGARPAAPKAAVVEQPPAPPSRPALPIRSWDLPADPFFLKLIANHNPDVLFDESRFLRLLAGSLSLSAGQKKQVIDAMPTLSQFQADELIKIFEKERAQFIDISVEHPDDIRKLDEKCQNEMVLLRTLCLLEQAAQGQQGDAFLSHYLAVETALLRFDADQAEALAGAAFDPCNLFAYEQWIKARKAQGRLQEEWLDGLVAQAAATGIPNLVDALLLLIDQERADTVGAETLLRRLKGFTPGEGLAWARPWLLSRFHAFLDPDEKAFEQAFHHLGAALAARIEEQAAANGPLLLLMKRCLLLKGDYDSVATWQGVAGGLGRYLGEVGWLLGPRRHNFSREQKDPGLLVSVLRPFAERMGIWMDLGLEQGQGGTQTAHQALKTRVDAFGQALAELGFSREEWPAQRAVEQALAEGRLEEAQQRLSEAWRAVGDDYGRKVALWGLQVTLWRREERLGAEIERLRGEYAATPSAWNGWRILVALFEVGHAGRATTRAFCAGLVRRFWFLPAFHDALFQVHHYLYTQPRHPQAAQQALQRAVSLGPAFHVLGSLAEYHRWNDSKDYHAALLASLLDGMFLDGHFGIAIVSALKLGWEAVGLSLFLLSARRRPYGKAHYNCFAIGLESAKARSATAIAAYAQALESSPELGEVLISNSADEFRTLAANHPSIWPWVLYRAVLSVWHRPQKTWLAYRALLAAAHELKRPDLYLGAYHVGLLHGATDWRDSEQAVLRTLLDDLIPQGQLRLPQTDDCAWLGFLAWSLVQEALWLTDERAIPVVGHAIYEVLWRIEELEERGGCRPEAFLATEGRRCYRELTLRDDWLLLRHPQWSGAQRHAHRAQTLAELAAEFPGRDYRQRLERMVGEWQRRQLYRGLEGGRIAHGYVRTLQAARGDVEEVIGRHLTARVASDRQRQAIEERLEELRSEAAQALGKHFASATTQLDDEARKRLLADWWLALGEAENREGFTGTLVRIGGHYGLDLTADREPLPSPVRSYLEEKARSRSLYDELDRYAQQQYRQHCTEAFAAVLSHHALAGSELFESFRTRIRHGWLIASLKDCFARFDLYQEGHTAAVFSPALARELAGLEAGTRAGLEAALGELRETFRSLVSRLDREWLWLRDAGHPEGLLDFAMAQFDIPALFGRLHLVRTPLETLVEAMCGVVDDRARVCFAQIRGLLHERVARPLDRRLLAIADWLEGARPAIRALPDGVHLYRRLHDEIESARKEFAQRMVEYASWFDFQEQAVRSFTLPEIVDLAWQVVAQVDGARLEGLGLTAPALLSTGHEVEGVWLAGENFSDLLEVFKVLFQNVVYHARPDGAGAGPAVELAVWFRYRADEGRLGCRIASTCLAPGRVDVAGLRAMLADPALCRDRAGGKQGSGLATAQEILGQRLHGARGELLGPELLTTAAAPLTAPPETAAWFVVEVALAVAQPAPPPEEPTTRPETDVAALAHGLAGYAVRVLVVEDQKAKFDALRAFLQTLLPGCGVAHTEDLESTARLLTSEGVAFDLLLLDMTLPEDPLPDAPLKSLAGLDLLKLLQVHDIPLPTVLVTQYSNWSSEAGQNSRQFMEELSANCRRDFPHAFRGAVRFSHTDLAWQEELRAVVAGLFDGGGGGAVLTAEAIAARLAADGDDRTALACRAEGHLAAGRCTEAVADWHHLARLVPDDPRPWAGLARAYAGLGLEAEAVAALGRYRTLGGGEVAAVQEQMLRGEMRALRARLQGQRQGEMMATLGRIAGGMAHEFFNPLAGIQAQVDLIRHRQQKGTLNEEGLLAALAVVEGEKQRMSDLVAHLRSLARGDKVARERVDVGAVVRQALALQERQLAGHGIAVEVAIGERLPRVWGNPLMLEQVFLNLLLNARDALDSVATPRRVLLTVKPRAHGGREWLEARVADNGPGVDEAVRERLFEPFFTTKEPGRGLGLGLALARETVQEYGGTIRLESPVEGGAEFVIELPVVEEEQGEADA